MTKLSTAERDDLAASVRRLLDRRCSPADVRAQVQTPSGFDVTLWSQLVDLGWLSIHIPEEHGGMGGSFLDTAVVLQEIGRHLTPGPFLGSAVLAADALVHARNPAVRDTWLPASLSGERLLAVATANPAGSYEASQLGVTWSASDGGVRLAGEARFVPDGASADGIIVSARDGFGAVAMAVVESDATGVTIANEPATDQTRRLARVHLDGVVVGDAALLGEPGRLSDLHERVTSLGAIVVAVDGLGAAERMLEITAQYAKERHQFGRPIGSFQAVKHHCANMLIDVEGARAAVSFAGEVLDDPSGDIHEAASVAASHASPACAHACQLAIQVHGGIGFTWDYDAHLYLKRAELDEALFGDASWHRRRLAAGLGRG